MRKGFLLCVVLLSGWVVCAQSNSNVIMLREVNITVTKDLYQAGNKVKSFDSVQLASSSADNLTELIGRYLPIYIKQDAGGIGTIRFRGTSANHTAVVFNGININSLTLGHSNMAGIPVFLFDEVKVQYGSSSSLYGSDAIGGSIQLNNNATWNQGLTVGLQQDVASFGSFFTGLKAGFSNKKFQTSIKLFKLKKENDFPFLNTAVKDFEKDEFVKDRMRNGAIDNFGILEESYYKISDKAYSYFKLWYENNWYQIQPNMSANYYGDENEEVRDKHVRAISGVKYFTGPHKFTVDAGYVYNYELYNNNSNQTIATNSYIFNTNYYNSAFFKGDLNSGVSLTYILPKVYAYDGQNNEFRTDFFALYLRSITNRLKASINLRQSFVTNYKSIFTPAVGLGYALINNDSRTLNLKASFSRSYKTPTFNDRYWYPNGNPDILPEKGMNYELNTNYAISKEHVNVKVGLGLFLIQVDNLIQWVNLDMWRPRNVRKANNSGLEFTTEVTKSFVKVKLNAGLNYSFTRAIEVKSYSATSVSTGKQLIYTPEHLGNVFLRITYRKWSLLTSGSYTGERFSEAYSTLDGYFLLNASVERVFNYKANRLLLDFKANNIFNKAYQNQEMYAMPGINFALSIKYTFNNKPKIYETN